MKIRERGKLNSWEKEKLGLGVNFLIRRVGKLATLSCVFF